MSANTMKPCPFCGSDMSSFVPEPEGCAGGGAGDYYVECDCGAMGAGGKTVAKAIAAWNRRTEPAGSAEPISANAEYVPGEWFRVRTIYEMQAFYMARLPAIRAAAKEHGYAIGLHGSTRRDFDLMAMQWRENASDKNSLAHAIAIAACGISRDGAYQWEQKPSGRFAVSIPICWTDHANTDFKNKPSVGHIDLSVIDHTSTVAGSAGKVGELPPLPEPPIIGTSRYGTIFRGFKEDQMREYARAALSHTAAQMTDVVLPEQRNMMGAHMLGDFVVQVEFRSCRSAEAFKKAVNAALLASNRQQESAPDWKPIASAPTDGTPVLLQATVGNMLSPKPQAVVGRYSRGWWLEGGKITLSHVTHWMEIPKFSAASNGAGNQEGAEG